LNTPESRSRILAFESSCAVPRGEKFLSDQEFKTHVASRLSERPTDTAAKSDRPDISPKMKRIPITLTDFEHARLKAISQAQGMSMNTIMRLAFEQAHPLPEETKATGGIESTIRREEELAH